MLEYAYAYYANASPFILDPALLKIVGLALFIGAFWMLIVMAIMDD